jgi:hypothetical protein
LRRNGSAGSNGHVELNGHAKPDLGYRDEESIDEVA